MKTKRGQQLSRKTGQIQYVKPLRELHPAHRGPVVPKARRIAGLMLRHPDTLDAEEQLTLKQVRAAACPHLDRLTLHITDFAQILIHLQGHRLDAWISAAETDDLSELRSFAAGLKRDHAAVIGTLAQLSGLLADHPANAIRVPLLIPFDP